MLETEKFGRTQKWETWLLSQVHICLFRCDVETSRPTITFFYNFIYFNIYILHLFKVKIDTMKVKYISIQQQRPPYIDIQCSTLRIRTLEVGTTCKHLDPQQFGDSLCTLKPHLTMTFLLICSFRVFLTILSKYYVPSKF